MFCSKCGKELPDNSKFCDVCGADIENNNSINDSVISIKNDPEIVRAALEGAAAVVSAQKAEASEINEEKKPDSQASKELNWSTGKKNTIIGALIVLVLLIGIIVANISEEGGDGDSDGDGIIDRYDECPNTPNGENVDPEGCSDSQSDTDGDGVSDRDDECPDTPEGEEVYEDGCSASQTPGFSFLLAITSLVIVSFLFYKKQD